MAKAQQKKKSSAPAAADRAGLLAQLSKLRPALRATAPVPELLHIWFRDGYAYAYDGSLGIRVACAAGLDCGLPGGALLGLLGTSQLAEVSLAQSGDVVTLKMGRSNTRLNLLASDHNPWPFADEPGDGAIKLTKDFVEALRGALSVRVAQAQAQRLEHRCVMVRREGKFVDFYGTDSNSIVRTTAAPPKGKFPDKVFLPRPLAEQVAELCPDGAMVDLADDFFAAWGTDGSTGIFSSVLDTTDIADVPAIMDEALKGHDEDVPVPGGIDDALDRADVLAGGGDAYVKMSTRGGALHLQGNYAYGDLDESFKLKADHPDLSVTVAVSAIRRGMAAEAFSVTDKSVAFYGGENFTYVVAVR